MTMQSGDKVTIRRGNLRGKVGEVKFTQGDKVALIMDSGELEVVNRTNIKEPTEATITQGELAALVNTVSGPAAGDGLFELVHAIDAKYPGFAGKVGWPVESDAEPTDNDHRY